MRKYFIPLLSALQLCIFHLSGQENTELFRIDNHPVSVAEFKNVYVKNLDLMIDDDAKDIEKYLDLFINYKLKVQDAYDLRLDTVTSYKKELEGYKKQLITPYLQDDETIDALVKEAYERSKTEVRASHILVQFSKNKKLKDTTAAYTKIVAAKQRILAGEKFEKIASEVSDDPSAKANGGDLGYFSAFRMVYPFEEKAYETKVGEVSDPFKTKFGYHIVYVTDNRPSIGEFEVAHILARDRTIAGKVRIDSLYQKIVKGSSFEEVAKKFSQDVGTASKGGKLPRFGVGSMVAEFENAVLALDSVNAIGTPIKTKYGWHIIKMLQKFPLGSLEEERKDIEAKVKRSDRIKLSQEAVLQKLKREYKVVVNKKALQPFYNSQLESLNEQELANTLVTIASKQIPQKDFYDFLKYRKNKAIDTAIEQFKNKELLTYFKEDLGNREPAYKNILTEYKEGLLLFALMQQKVWQKSASDSIGLQKYFIANKKKYKGGLEASRGILINNYQKVLEEQLVEELRRKYTVRINKNELEKLKRTYAK